MSKEMWSTEYYKCDISEKEDLEVQFARDGMNDGTVTLEMGSCVPIVFLNVFQVIRLRDQLNDFINEEVKRLQVN